MAPYFSEKQLAELHWGRQKLVGQQLRMQLRLETRKYKSERGREYAFHGFGRRLGLLVGAIDQVFTLLPPERESIPKREEVVNATIAIQSFVFNVVGCLDNLAWIWVYEKDVKDKDGGELDPKSVGLWKTHKQVRASLSSSFQEYLNSREAWFESLRDFRDSLAHRIPLYIPPYAVEKSNIDEHDRLEQEANAALQRLNHQEYDRLRGEQRKLGVFRPWMTHSLVEQAPGVVFHFQLLSDFATIDEMGSKIFDELEAPPQTRADNKKN